MSTFKKCSVVMLSTNEKANNKEVGIGTDNTFRFNNPNLSEIFKPLFKWNIYFLSNKDIKEGDWVYDTEAKYIRQLIHKFNQTDFDVKIIAATDKSLNLPSPSKSFIDVYIEEYNKGNQIKEVMIEYEEYISDPYEDTNEGDWKTDNLCKIKVNIKDNTITIRKIKDSWNKDEVEELLHKCWLQATTKTLEPLEAYGFKTFIANNL